jgi:hypothetical protein
MGSQDVSLKEVIRQQDEALLASLGYKQEFKRAFTPIEVSLVSDSNVDVPLKHLTDPQVFGIAFSIIGLLPSIGSVLFYAVGNGGGPSMVWGVGSVIYLAPTII